MTAATENETRRPISVVIVDDHEVVALGLTALLDDVDTIDVIGAVTTMFGKGGGINLGDEIVNLAQA